MFSDPQKNISQLGLVSGQKVADLGSGPGHYALALAEMLGGASSIYCVDVQQDLLTKLKNEASRRNFNNIETIWGDIEAPGGTKLGNNSMDAAVVANVLFQAESKEGVLNEAARILKPGARVLVVDWAESFGGLGPPPNHVITADEVRKIAGAAGFSEEREIQAGANHWGIIFIKK